jgi:predicted 2-oxoglutarate/Fe(II)-dependent dioxygenase YbiX
LPVVQDYSRIHNINNLQYWEAFNFIKYGPGQHFKEHHDHGFSYNCTVSLVAYPNDDYEGGELFFRLQGLTLKPEAGDLFVFPSNFMYPHQAMPVHSGIKHSIVTMLDYNKKYHTPEMYQGE